MGEVPGGVGLESVVVSGHRGGVVQSGLSGQAAGWVGAGWPVGGGVVDVLVAAGVDGVGEHVAGDGCVEGFA